MGYKNWSGVTGMVAIDYALLAIIAILYIRFCAF
jgi:hypothetical protein